MSLPSQDVTQQTTSVNKLQDLCMQLEDNVTLKPRVWKVSTFFSPFLNYSPGPEVPSLGPKAKMTYY